MAAKLVLAFTIVGEHLVVYNQAGAWRAECDDTPRHALISPTAVLEVRTPMGFFV
jgi:hypothetical protein